MPVWLLTLSLAHDLYSALAHRAPYTCGGFRCLGPVVWPSFGHDLDSSGGRKNLPLLLLRSCSWTSCWEPSKLASAERCVFVSHYLSVCERELSRFMCKYGSEVATFHIVSVLLR